MNQKKPKKPAKATPKKAKTQRPDFEDLIENSAQGILIHRNFKPLYANKTFAALLSYKKSDEILALPLLRPLFSPDFWAKMENDYDERIRSGNSAVVARMPLRRKDGSEIWVAGTQRVIDWHGEPALQMGLFDISSQMAVEQNLLKSEQHLRSVLEILPYPIYIARRADGRLLFVNRKTCLLYQRSAGQLLRGTSVDFYANPKEREDIRKLLDTLSDIRDVEVKMKTSSGQEFTAEMSAIAMEYNGQPAILVALNDVSERKALEAELQRQASTDPLTGIANRRHFLALAENELRRSRRFARPLAVLMIDIDHFKPINDHYGHAVGDAVLQGVVRRALESLRQSDVMARLGGEEFAALLPETSFDAAVEAAERLRQHLAERPVIAERAAVPCTVSIGVAEMRPDEPSIDHMLGRADEALYIAKNNGRNRVERAS